MPSRARRRSWSGSGEAARRGCSAPAISTAGAGSPWSGSPASTRRRPAPSCAAGGDRAGLLALCRSILAAYARLHERGVIHGDVHPRNVLVGPAGEVHLIDFGLSLAGGPGGGSRARGRGLLLRAGVCGGGADGRTPARGLGRGGAVCPGGAPLPADRRRPHARFQARQGRDAAADRRGSAAPLRPPRRRALAGGGGDPRAGPRQGARRAVRRRGRLRTGSRRCRAQPTAVRRPARRPRRCSPASSTGWPRAGRSSARGSPCRRAPRSPTAPRGSPAASTASPWRGRTRRSSRSPICGR